MTRSRVLDQTDLFGQMPPDLLNELSGRTELSKYRRNELICEQGEIAEKLFIVFSGRVAITVKASDSRESVVAVLGQARCLASCRCLMAQHVRPMRVHLVLCT